MSVAITNRFNRNTVEVGNLARKEKVLGLVEVPKVAPGRNNIEKDVDACLVARTLEGDTQAFDMLVIKYQSRIARLVSVYIKDFDAARDVVQESFIRAYKALNNYRRESRFYTWLYRIAVNTSYNYLKSNKSRLTRMESIEGNLQAEQAESLFKNPEQSYQNDDLRRGIQRAVSLLPLELRSALVLREVEGMSYEQIAEVVGCELGTVKSRISRARERVVQKTKHLYESTQK